MECWQVLQKANNLEVESNTDNEVFVNKLLRHTDSKSPMKSSKYHLCLIEGLRMTEGGLPKSQFLIAVSDTLDQVQVGGLRPTAGKNGTGGEGVTTTHTGYLQPNPITPIHQRLQAV